MTDHDALKVLRNIQVELSSKGLTECQLRENIGSLVSEEFSQSYLVCDKAWRTCEAKVESIYPLLHWSNLTSVGTCVVHGGEFHRASPTVSIA